MTENEFTLSARISELERQMVELRKQIAQNNQAVRQSDRQIFLQVIIFPVVMFSVLIGTIFWLS